MTKQKKLINYLRVEVSIGRVDPHPEQDKEPLARTCHICKHGSFEMVFDRREGKEDPERLLRTKRGRAYVWLVLHSAASHYLHLFITENLKAIGRSKVWG